MEGVDVLTQQGDFARASGDQMFGFGDDGKEGPVNFTVRGDYLVIDGVAPRYVLRRGKAHMLLTNLAPRPPKPVAETASASEVIP